jgi:rRNA maturation endonuclease Nob1
VTERRCHGCRTFYDARQHACPECGTPKHQHNSGLESQVWATALNAKADWAVKNG